MSDHEAIMTALKDLSEDVREIKADVKAQNGRVRKIESTVAVLRWVVFVAFPALGGAVWVLFQMHLR